MTRDEPQRLACLGLLSRLSDAVFLSQRAAYPQPVDIETRILCPDFIQHAWRCRLRPLATHHPLHG